MKIAIWLALVLGVVAQYRYSYSASYTCTAKDVKICTSWTLQMSIQQDIGCFPSDQKVVTQSGIKKMSEIKVGDKLLGYDKAVGPIYTPIKSWLHRMDGSSYLFKYQKISSLNGQMYISPMHNIAVRGQNQQLSYIFAKDVNSHHHLFGNNEKILSNQLQMKAGLYAPLTHTFNFYIVLSQQRNIIALVHCFAHIANPQFFQSIYYYIETIASQFGISNEQSNEGGLSQLNLLLMKWFPSIFVETPTIQQINLKNGVLMLDSFDNSANNNNNDKEQYQVQVLASYLIFVVQNQLSS